MKNQLHYLVFSLSVIFFASGTDAQVINAFPYEQDFESFTNKHAESSFTKFYEGYWLPARFGFDTRRITYSSQILTGQMSREDAIRSLKEPALNEIEIKNESNFVAKKLRISEKELQSYFLMPKKTYKDYKNISIVFKIATMLFRLMKGDTSGARR